MFGNLSMPGIYDENFVGYFTKHKGFTLIASPLASNTVR